MKKLFIFLLLFSYVRYASADEFFHRPPARPGDYSWEMTDESFKTIARGMVRWGLFMAAFTLLFAGFMPNSPSPTPVKGTSTSGSGNLTNPT